MHDKYGHPLKEGDEVLVHATVVHCHTGTDEYCNITVEAAEPMFPGEEHTIIVLNAKQVMKAKKGHGYPVPLDVPIPGQTPQPPEPPPEGGGS